MGSTVLSARDSRVEWYICGEQVDSGRVSGGVDGGNILSSVLAHGEN